MSRLRVKCNNSLLTMQKYNDRQVGLLIRRGADLNVRDFNDSDLLSIALERADADIVTL